MNQFCPPSSSDNLYLFLLLYAMRLQLTHASLLHAWPSNGGQAVSLGRGEEVVVEEDRVGLRVHHLHSHGVQGVVGMLRTGVVTAQRFQHLL